MDSGSPGTADDHPSSRRLDQCCESGSSIDHSAANPRQTDVRTIRVKVGEEEWDDQPFNGIPIHLEVTEEGQTKIQAQAIDDIGNKSTIVERTVKISRSGLKLDEVVLFR